MTAEILVGVDVGTTSIKALAVSPGGTVLGESSRPTPWRHDGGRADVDPTLLADTAIAVCADAASAAAMGASGSSVVRSVGVTGIAETGALLDARGNPCAPALAWFDPRGDAQAVKDAIGRAAFQRTTGTRLNSRLSICKILWLQQNVPGAEAGVRHLCVGEWVVRSLGGDEVAELSLTSRTGLLDLTRMEPWPPSTDLTGVGISERRVWAGDNVGTANGDIPEILRGAVLTVAGLDHYSAAFVSGAIRDGVLFDSMGTAEALIRTVAGALTPEQIELLTERDVSVDWSVIPDHQMLLAGRLTGLSLERIAALLGVNDRDARRAIGEAALAEVRGPDAPSITDLGNDHLAITGITDGASPALLWRAAVEDLTVITDAALADIAAAVGPHDSAVVVGGWSRNPMVASAKRRQLGEHRTSDLAEPGALGAAFLGGVAAGILDRPGPDGIPRWQDG
jgi:sugar (pentulose or hexulose) kinase